MTAIKPSSYIAPFSAGSLALYKTLSLAPHSTPFPLPLWKRYNRSGLQYNRHLNTYQHYGAKLMYQPYSRTIRHPDRFKGGLN